MQQTVFQFVQLLTIFVAMQQTYNATHNASQERSMAKRALSAIDSFFEVFGSAVAVSRAIESRQRPNSRDLRNLGIDPAKFRSIHRF